MFKPSERESLTHKTIELPHLVTILLNRFYWLTIISIKFKTLFILNLQIISQSIRGVFEHFRTMKRPRGKQIRVTYIFTTTYIFNFQNRTWHLVAQRTKDKEHWVDISDFRISTMKENMVGVIQIYSLEKYLMLLFVVIF